MYRDFLKWVETKRYGLKKLGITTENINVTEESLLNPSTSVDHFSQVCIGRVSVWETGEMDVEVLHFETEKRLLFEHFELGAEPDYDEILRGYFQVLISGVTD
ncbi:hypothetical protein CLHUN_42920 [Ruminiclostridium hungatei]|uniref:Uncharacterized protein n=1 Tax=Ruminiclostridium hungatei TaxID=48256 RepID=A0A1V4SDB2_RUMHU|nr:hypothetical protein [Ruminiclostridium hungatei]OPX41840.1 hypothetical protein CLHUN_42920 [Ruminiclostridium hungatei]